MTEIQVWELIRSFYNDRIPMVFRPENPTKTWGLCHWTNVENYLGYYIIPEEILVLIRTKIEKSVDRLNLRPPYRDYSPYLCSIDATDANIHTRVKYCSLQIRKLKNAV